MEWPQQFFDASWLEHVFPLVAPEQSRREAEFIERALALQKGQMVLDLCCGIGRHSMPLADRGYRVTGLDASPDYITRARSIAANRPARPAFAEGDMRKIPYANMFDAAFCVWSSFGFYDAAADIATLKGLAKSLKKGGGFLLDVANRDYIVRHFQERDWARGNKGCILKRRIFYPDKSRLVSTWLFVEAGRTIRKTSDIRLYALHEIEALLSGTGFRVSARFGDFGGSRPGPDASRIIIAAAT